MKIGYFLFLTVLAVSCSVKTVEPLTRNGGSFVTTLPFSKYIKKGFEFSTYPPTGSYSVVGVLDAELQPRIIPLTLSETKKILEINNGSEITVFEVRTLVVNKKYKKYGVQINLNPFLLLDDIYTKGAALGANGVADLELFYETRNTNGLDYKVLKSKGVFIKSD
jgi:hypothetical protein